MVITSLGTTRSGPTQAMELSPSYHWNLSTTSSPLVSTPHPISALFIVVIVVLAIIATLLLIIVTYALWNSCRTAGHRTAANKVVHYMAA